jgi:ubiquinone/menaquinone biosynthesis C-methylase UbiE
VTLRLRRERFIVGLRGLALLRGWPFGSAAQADDQLDLVRDALSGDALGSDAALIDVDDLGVRDAYGDWAETYDCPNPLFDAEEPAVRDLLAGIEPGRACDVATGTARLGRVLESLGHDVTAVDASLAMLGRARNKVRGSLVAGDVDRLPFRDASFDLVICGLALTHIPSLERPIAELARILRPDGYLLVTDIHPIAVVTGGHAFFARSDGSRGVLRNELHWPSNYVEAFRSAGLTVERAAEPLFRDSFVDEMPEKAIRDAARDAVVGLPFALVWLARKTQ